MRTGAFIFSLILTSLVLTGCSSHAPPPSGRLADSITVMAQLNDQLHHWQGTPYRYGGLDENGVDCSGFVYRTFRDRFDLQLPRTTAAQTELGTKVSRDELLPGDLVFFKTGSGESGLHVGIYDSGDQFIHASTSRGVMRSSLENVYWKKAYWQARRI
jgi:probable lipoprotein NlpC